MTTSKNKTGRKKKTTTRKVQKTSRKVATVDKDKGGRPPRLTKELCDQLDIMINNWDPFNHISYDKEFSDQDAMKAFMLYLDLSTKDNVAFNLGISSSMLYDYQGGYREKFDSELVQRFSEAIKRWETKRNAFHMKIRPFFARAEASWIFLAKNFNQFEDKVKFEHSGTTLKVTETERRVQQSEVPKIGKSIEIARAKVH